MTFGFALSFVKALVGCSCRIFQARQQDIDTFQHSQSGLPLFSHVWQDVSVIGIQGFSMETFRRLGAGAGVSNARL